MSLASKYGDGSVVTGMGGEGRGGKAMGEGEVAICWVRVCVWLVIMVIAVV